MKRPIGIWLVTIYAALNAVISALGFYVLLSGKMPAMSGQQANFFESLGALDYALSVLFHVCIAIGGICIFMFRKMALYFFIAGAGFNLISTIWQILTHRFMAGVGGASLTAWVELMLAWAIILAIIVYCTRLTKNGVLT